MLYDEQHGKAGFDERLDGSVKGVHDHMLEAVTLL